MTEIIIDAVESGKQTPGQILKAAREASKMGVAEVAQRLLLSKAIIIALESDDYSKIAAKVYAEGYLKAYAKILKLSVEEILTRFRALHVYAEMEYEFDSQRGVLTHDSTKKAVSNQMQQLGDLFAKLRCGKLPHGLLLAVLIGLIVILGINFFLGHLNDGNNASSNVVLAKEAQPVLTVVKPKQPEPQNINNDNEKSEEPNLVLTEAVSQE